MSTPERNSGGGKLLAGLAVLPILCCGLPALIGAGVFTGTGALLGSGALVAAGLVAVLVTLAVRRSRRAADTDCCRPDAPGGDRASTADTADRAGTADADRPALKENR